MNVQLWSYLKCSFFKENSSQASLFPSLGLVYMKLMSFAAEDLACIKKWTKSWGLELERSERPDLCSCSSSLLQVGLRLISHYEHKTPEPATQLNILNMKNRKTCFLHWKLILKGVHSLSCSAKVIPRFLLMQDNCKNALNNQLAIHLNYICK